MSLPVHWLASLAGAVAGDELTVEGDEAHHAVAVRRLRVGERVVLTDGAGTTVTGEVATTGKRVFTVIADRVDTVPEPTPAITVVQALPKGERGELAVEMLTEIGVSTIVPWGAERSVAVWRGERAAKSLARWRSTAREAAKQSRRAWFPEVTEAASTQEVAALLRAADLGVVLHEDAAVPFAGLAATAADSAADFRADPAARLVVVVGPEGGVSEDELATFAAAGARPVRLGDEVLRTSTAGVAAVAALLSRTARWGAS